MSLFFIRHEVPILNAGPLGQFGESSCSLYRGLRLFVLFVISDYMLGALFFSRPERDDRALRTSARRPSIVWRSTACRLLRAVLPVTGRRMGLGGSEWCGLHSVDGASVYPRRRSRAQRSCRNQRQRRHTGRAGHVSIQTPEGKKALAEASTVVECFVLNQFQRISHSRAKRERCQCRRC